MNNFISLKSGIIINVGAAAFIHPQPGPILGPRGIQIVFPSIAVENQVGGESSLSVIVAGEEADALMAKLKGSGVDTDYLAAALKDSGCRSCLAR